MSDDSGDTGHSMDRDDAIMSALDAMNKHADAWVLFYYMEDGERDLPGFVTSSIREIPYIADICLDHWADVISRRPPNRPEPEDDDCDDDLD